MRKILVSAYACEPYKGSEQAVGWNIVLELAKTNDVHVITRANNKIPIEKYLHNSNNLHLTFHYYDAPKLFLSLKNKEKGVYLYYIIWQIGIIMLAYKIVKRYGINYSYHLTFGSIWLPTFLFLLPTRFLWGPVGGGESIPNTFISTLSLRGKLLQYLRKILILTVYLNPVFLLSSLKAKAILCRTPDTIKVFPKSIRHKCYILTDGAIEKEIFQYKQKSSNREEIHLIATSRLIHTKNVLTLIKAISLIPCNYNIKLTIIGSGPDEESIKKLIFKLGLSNRITLIPFIPRLEVLKQLELSDVYLFGSLKEACNLSLLEAMAIGLPVICLNWSGMAISTDDSCAIRLPVTNPEQMPEDMAAAIIKLIENPELRESMGKAGRKRIKEIYNWENKGDFINKLLDRMQDHSQFLSL